MPEPKKRDPQAPANLIVEIKDNDGRVWGTITAAAKQFSSGSVGFYANSKIENPDSHERYQVSGNIILIGSKPEAE
ncbi:hypothetical protein L0337_44450 [candidate division KSB1 bacterium]|nr:hypothetical protein [candidate division KSB1 bacterium]